MRQKNVRGQIIFFHNNVLKIHIRFNPHIQHAHFQQISIYTLYK